MDLTKYGASPYGEGGKARNDQQNALSAALRGFMGQEETGSVLDPRTQDLKSINDKTNLVSILSDLIPAKGAAALPHAAGIFIGPKAKTWNAQAAAKAAELLRAGHDAEYVRQLTGTSLAPDRTLRQEISDEGLRLRSLFERTGPNAGNNYKGAPPMPLGGVVDHPELFKAYPELLRNSKIDLRQQPDWMPDSANTGEYKGNKIRVRDKTESGAKGTLIHELQHNVQDIEGFARGGSPEEFMKDAQWSAQVQGKDRDWAERKALHDYLRLAGEVEARLAQQRRGMSAEELRANAPEPDIPPHLQKPKYYGVPPGPLY